MILRGWPITRGKYKDIHLEEVKVQIRKEIPRVSPESIGETIDLLVHVIYPQIKRRIVNEQMVLLSSDFRHMYLYCLELFKIIFKYLSPPVGSQNKHYSLFCLNFLITELQKSDYVWDCIEILKWMKGRKKQQNFLIYNIKKNYFIWNV